MRSISLGVAMMIETLINIEEFRKFGIHFPECKLREKVGKTFSVSLEKAVSLV